MYKKILMIILAAVLLLGAFQPSQAAMQAVGPVSPATGHFPVWYQAGTTTLELCLSKTPSPDPGAGGAPLCNLLPAPGFDPLLPVVFPTNFPDEAFWFGAEASIVDAAAGIDVRFVSAVEAAFSTGLVQNGDQISFSRIRFFVQVPTPGTYTFTHPFGIDTFVVDTIDPTMREIQYTRDIGVANGIFTGALAGDIGPFLVRSNAPGGAPTPIVIGAETFLGDPNVTQFITGSSLGTNYVRIQGPGGIDLTTDQFLISGKVFGGTLPPPLTFDRTTYSRTAAGGTKVEVFATSDPAATLTFRETVAAGAETALAKDAATGRFYTQYAPAALPSNLIATATVAGAPPTLLGSPVIDLVKITKAAYSFTTKELTVEATSSDQVPLPTLTAAGWGALTAPAAGGFTQTLVVPNVLEPPAKVTVLSSAGGFDTEPVVVPLLNLPPVAANDTALTNQGVAAVINVLANDTDPDQNLPLTVPAASLTQPVNGTAAVNLDQTVTYTPNAGFTGTDSFTYRAADARGALSNIATVTVTVNAVPVANPDTATTLMGAAVVINVLANDTDADGTLDPASVTVGTAPAGGTTAINTTTGAVTYTPNAGFTGTDSFAYTVADNVGAVSNAATVTVTVNDPPVANPDTATTTAGLAVVINVLANDTNVVGTINPASVTVGTAPTGGTTAINTTTGAITYTPNTGFNGTDSFAYTVADSFGAVSNAATVTVTVTAANLPPVANADAATTVQGTAATIAVLANDTDPDGPLPLTVVNLTQPAVGTGAVAINADQTVTYTPPAPFSGTATFTYQARDGLGALSPAATVAVTVTAVNLPPTANPDAATTVQGTAVTIAVLANDTDPNGNLPLTAANLTPPAAGTGAVVLNAGQTVTYTPPAAFSGTATFTYQARNSLGALSPAATVTVTVSAPNAAPVALNDTATTNAGVPVVVTVLANDSSTQGLNRASVAIATAPANGSALVNALNGTVTYRSNPGYSGTDSFTYTVRDKLGAVSNAATVTITLDNPLNGAPFAANDTARGSRRISINVAGNDRAVRGSRINRDSVLVVTPPAHGTATISRGIVRYVPVPGYVGVDTFAYTVQDNLGRTSNTATVTVTIRR